METLGRNSRRSDMRKPRRRHTQCTHYTAWCSEIGSLRSLDAPELHASVTSEDQFHCTTLYMHHVLSIATKMISAPPSVRGILQGGQQMSSTFLMYTAKRGRGSILIAIESTVHSSTEATSDCGKCILTSEGHLS